jgi:Domain of unknown function (DUF1707)/Cell wall-active antibiotics response 4TMS YvqF
MPDSMPADHAHLRASDADRERVARVLHDAMAEGRLSVHELDVRLKQTYEAVTFGQLEPITKDLPAADHDAKASMPESAGSTEVDRKTGASLGVTNSFAFMSGFRRAGKWVVPSRHNAFAVMGGGKIDLREARLTGQTTTIRAVAVMGGIEIIVPEDITVRVEGVGVMGGFDGASHEGPPDAPVVHVKGLAFWGGVEIKRRNREQRDIPEIES